MKPPTSIFLTGNEYYPCIETIQQLAELVSNADCALCHADISKPKADRHLLGVQYIDSDPTFDEMGMVVKLRIQPAYVCQECYLDAIDHPEKVAATLDASPVAKNT